MSEFADITFNSPAPPWNETQTICTAMRIQSAFLGLKLTDEIWVTVEFLKIGSHKNQVVFRATFDTVHVVDGSKYYGVRISMDVSDKAFGVFNNDEVSFIFRLPPLVV